jgi:hypothetical protein
MLQLVAGAFAVNVRAFRKRASIAEKAGGAPRTTGTKIVQRHDLLQQAFGTRQRRRLSHGKPRGHVA